MVWYFQVIVEKFGMFARFGFMHLVATNLSLWIRTVIWESANEWIHHIHRYVVCEEVYQGELQTPKFQLF